jgi:hypothetical protein
MKPTTFFSGIDEFCIFGHISQKFGVGQIVVDNHFGVFKQVFPSEGNQTRIAGTSTDKIDFAAGDRG